MLSDVIIWSTPILYTLECITIILIVTLVDGLSDFVRIGLLMYGALPLASVCQVYLGYNLSFIHI